MLIASDPPSRSASTARNSGPVLERAQPHRAVVDQQHHRQTAEERHQDEGGARVYPPPRPPPPLFPPALGRRAGCAARTASDIPAQRLWS